MTAQQFFARLVFAFPLLLSPVPAPAGSAATAEGNSASTAYVFTCLTGNGEVGLHLAASKNGYQWEVLIGGRSYLKAIITASRVLPPPPPAESAGQP